MTERTRKLLPVLLLLTAWLLMALPERPRSRPDPAPPGVPLTDESARDASTTTDGSDTASASDPRETGNRAGRTPFPPEACTIGGCSIGHHSISPLTRKQYDRFLEAFNDQPVSPESDAFEKLIYYGKQTRAFMNSYGTAPLGERRAKALERELTKTRAFVSVRVTDETGTVRLRTERKHVPLGESKHFPINETVNLPTPELSGTVYRVGVNHLWARY